MAVRILCCLIAASLAALPSSRSASPRSFSGTWEARLKGALICTLELHAGQSITGAMLGCTVRVNEAGDLIESDPPDGPQDHAPILGATLQGDTLRFETRDEEDERPLRFELHLTGRSRADLLCLDAPVPVKPIHFQRR
jgi:hypothetical protein